MYCRYCGAQIDNDSVVCEYCGRNLKETYHREESTNTYKNINKVNQSDKSRIVAGVLALLLGGIGVHNFYMGKIGRGILDIIFSWTCIPALIAFIQGIIILVETDEAFERRLNS